MTETKSKRRTAKTIRNRTNKMVHLRLTGEDNDKPYRVELNPRGRVGDWQTIPARLTDNGTFIQGEGRLFEVIPLSEARKIEYGPQAAVTLPPATLVTLEESVISRTADWDGQGRAPERNEQISPRTADVPGSDPELAAAYAAGGSALPDGALDKPLTVERVKGD
jgi:hypothetical protein